MDSLWWYVAIAGALAMILILAGAVVLMMKRRKFGGRSSLRLADARQRFHRRREWLEARFLTLASQSGKPRGLAWMNCEFDDDVSFARDRHTGELRALVAITVSFEAVEGGGMEDNPNVGNLRAATAVFRLDHDQWTTDGRAVFNLSPAQTIQHFQNELETAD